MGRDAVREIALVQQALNALNSKQGKAAVAASTFTGRITAMSQALVRAGSQLQWVGRQLVYNFSLPLAAAGGFATKWAFDNEKAMTRVRKVYGWVGKSASETTTELEVLGRYFRTLSDYFAVNQAEVIDVAASWAAAGATGAALGKAVKATMEMMILGEMEAAEATDALISVQSQYKLSAEELNQTIAELNMVENQTKATMSGLIQSFSRTAGVAVAANVSTKELASTLAVLAANGVSAALAGNALKAIYQRVMNAPTKEGIAAYKELGIVWNSASFQAMNASQRLVKMAEGFQKVEASQKSAIATALVGIYQGSKFVYLLNDMSDANGTYQKTMETLTKSYGKTTAAEILMAQKTKELQMVLSSNPQRFKQMLIMLQNMATDAILPLIPLIMRLMGVFVSLGKMIGDFWKSLEKTGMQQAIFSILTFIAVFGLALKIIGAGGALIAELTIFLLRLGKVIVFPFTALAWAAKMAFGLTFGLASKFLTGMINMGLGTSSVLKALGRTFFGTAAKATFLQKAALKAAIVLKVGLKNSLLAVAKAGGSAFVGIIKGIGTLVKSTGMFSTVASGWGWMVGYMGRLWKLLLFYLTNSSSVTFKMLGKFVLAFFSGLRGGLFRMFPIFSVAAAQMRTLGMAWAIVMRNMTTALRTGMITPVIGSLMNFFKVLGGGFGAMGRYLVGSAVVMSNGISAAFMRLHSRVLLIFKSMWTWIARTTLIGILSTGSMITAGSSKIARIWILLKGFMVGATLKAWTLIKKIVISGIVGLAAAMQAGGKLAVLWGKIWQGMVWIVNGGWKTIIATTWRGILLVAKLIVSPWGLALAAVLGLIYLFRDQLAIVWQRIVDGFMGIWSNVGAQLNSVGDFFANFNKFMAESFNALPSQVQTALLAVARVVQKIVAKIAEWMSYLNPFARHSPSLVDNVTNGMTVIIGQFRRLSSLGPIIAGAYAKIRQFKDMMASFMYGEAINVKFADDLQAISQINPSASPIAEGMVSDIKKLSPELDALAEEMRIQEASTKAWKDQMEAAEKTMQAQQDRLASLSGELEFLTGTRESLVQAGAGSDITGVYDQQINAVLEQKAAIKETVKEYDAIKARYEQEQAALDATTAKYNQVKDAVNALEQALSEMGGAARAAISAAESAAGAAGSGAGGAAGGGAGGSLGAAGGGIGGGKGFGLGDPVTGSGSILQGGDLGDLEKEMEEISKGFQESMDALNPFNWLADQWKGFTQWMQAYIQPALAPLGAMFANLFGGIDWMAPIQPFLDWWNKELMPGIEAGGKLFMDIFGPDFQRLWTDISSGASEAWGYIWDGLQTLFKVLGPFVKYLLGIIGIVLGVALKVVMFILNSFLKPVMVFIGMAIGAVSKFIAAIVQIIVGIFDVLTGKGWDNLGQGILNLLNSLWSAITSIFWGIVNSVVGFFTELYDQLIGHSIVVDIVEGIQEWFGNLIGFFVGFGKWLLNAVLGPWVAIGKALMDAWNSIWTNAKSAFDKLGKWFDGFWKALGAAWNSVTNTLKKILSDAWDSAWKTASDIFGKVSKFFGDTWKGIETGVKGFVDAVGKKWAELKSLAQKPIEFVVNTVFGGMAEAFNKIGKVVGITLPVPHVSFDAGGWTGPGSKYQPAGLVHADEYVIRKESQQKISRENPGALDYMNKYGKLPGFAGGGLVGNLLDPVKNFFGGLINKIPGAGLLVDVVSKLPGKLFDAMVEKVGKGMKSMFAAGSALGAVAGGLNPTFLARFKAWNAALGNKYSIAVGYRSYAQQARLYDLWKRGLYDVPAVAPPGKSKHQYGLAIDLNKHASAADRALARQFGLYFPMASEPWHLQPLYKGGLVKAARRARVFDAGGTLYPGLNLVDNRTGAPEPLVPAGSGSGPSGNTYIFNDAKFEFPNITSAGDAKKFLENLESVVWE